MSLARRLAWYLNLTNHKVDIQTASPDDEISRVFETMLKLGIRRLPIVQEGKLVGIVTEKGLARWVLRVFYEPNIPEELRSLVKNPRWS